MAKRRKTLIFASSLLLGTITVGGTAYAVIDNKNKIEAENNRVAKEEYDQQLNVLRVELEGLVSESGYLKEGLTSDRLDEFKNKINSVDESFTNFRIDEDTENNEIVVYKLSKEELTDYADTLKHKLAFQLGVNSLFEGDVLNGLNESEQAVKKGLKKDHLQEIKDSAVDSDTKWGEYLLSKIDDAESQMKYISKVNKSVKELNESLDSEDYETAVSSLDDIQNETIRGEMKEKLDGVSIAIKEKQAEETRLKGEAETARKAEEAKQVAQAEVEKQETVQQQQSGGNNTQESSGNSSTQKSASNQQSAPKQQTSNSNTQQSTPKKTETKKTESSKSKTESNKSDGETQYKEAEKGKGYGSTPTGVTWKDEDMGSTWIEYEANGIAVDHNGNLIEVDSNGNPITK